MSTEPRKIARDKRSHFRGARAPPLIVAPRNFIKTPAPSLQFPHNLRAIAANSSISRRRTVECRSMNENLYESPKEPAKPSADPLWWTSAWCVVAAFGAYFCMYLFRKPFTVAEFKGIELAGIDYKTVLLISQVAGYA